jgi:hypothetical protein
MSDLKYNGIPLHALASGQPPTGPTDSQDDDLYSDTIEVQTTNHVVQPPASPLLPAGDGAADEQPRNPTESVEPLETIVDSSIVTPRSLEASVVDGSPKHNPVPEQPANQILVPFAQSDTQSRTPVPDAVSTAPTNAIMPNATASVTMSESVDPQPQPFHDMPRLDMPRTGSQSTGDPKTSSRRVKEYTMPDGTVVSGKGLGRGRPGIKRGPRKSKSLTGDGQQPDGASPQSSVSTPPVNGIPSSNKRRRSGTNIKADSPDSDSMLSDSRDSTPEYNPTEETRSGRKIQKPPTNANQVAESASPASKRPRLENRQSTTTSSPAVKLHPKIKRKMYKGREQLALCEHCQRGHGPVGNVIVFCDACNKCWHQRCHEPQVPQSVINDSKAEWFCVHCEKILHGKKGKKAKLNGTEGSTSQPTKPQFVGPLIGGAGLSQVHKIAYLESLTKEQLIALILQGSDLAPALPMFQAPAPQLPQAEFKSNYITPASSTPGLHPSNSTADQDDEGYDSYFDEHAALYPKPGNGVKLPPESADVHMLLEHPQSRTFSHWVRGMPTREFSGGADVVFQR